MSTGWWGIPGDRQGTSSTKVHFTLDGPYPKPLCGVRLGSLMRYQWCAVGFELGYVECERCKKKARWKETP